MKRAKRKLARGGSTGSIDGTQLPDRRAVEGQTARLFGGTPSSPVDQAQEVMYQAWDTDDEQQRIKLARRALEISPDCADAYVLLAEHASRSLDEALELYRKGVAAGERALGPEAVETDVGHFWGLVETRPYMRARKGLAECLWVMNHRDESLDHYRELLRLNPDDNQGARWELMPRLIEMGLDEEAEALYARYESGLASWGFSRALLDFRKQGDSEQSRASLAAAIENNRFAVDYLGGRKRLPREIPSYHGIGDENEAVVYVYESNRAWNATSGAIDWLLEAARAKRHP